MPYRRSRPGKTIAGKAYKAEKTACVQALKQEGS